MILVLVAIACSHCYYLHLIEAHHTQLHSTCGWLCALLGTCGLLGPCHSYLHMGISSQVQWVLALLFISIGKEILPIKFPNAVEAFGYVRWFYILNFFSVGLPRISNVFYGSLCHMVRIIASG